MTSAQGSNPNWEQLKKDAMAEKEALDAQKQLIDARKALEAAQVPADLERKANDDKIAAATVAKALADAEKAAADSKKAQADASLAALKAQIGDIPSSGFTGEVTMKEKAGVIEAALLAAKAVNVVSDKITAMIGTEKLKNKTVLLYSVAEVPSFQSLISFRAQIAIVENAFTQAQRESDDAKGQPTDGEFKEEGAPIVAAAGLALDAINKVIGYFRTDYTVGGIDVSLGDTMLVNSLAGKLKAKNSTTTVKLPAVYNAPSVSSASETGVIKQLTDLAMKKARFQATANRYEKVFATFTEKAGDEKDPEEKAALVKQAAAHKNAADILKVAFNVYDAFYAKLVAVDDKGVVPLTNLIWEDVVATALQTGNILLLVKIHKSGGAYYTKKNLWTFFGGMPFYHMGGVVGSFVLLGGKDGEVFDSGVVPIHGGFVQADNQKKNVN